MLDSPTEDDDSYVYATEHAELVRLLEEAVLALWWWWSASEKDEIQVENNAQAGG